MAALQNQRGIMQGGNHKKECNGFIQTIVVCTRRKTTTTNKQAKGTKMKFKVKGLVFVGFAAAILSANAAFANPDNTVTSKSYVDTKFQAQADRVATAPASDSEDWSSKTKYPSMNVLSSSIDALEQSISQTGAGIGTGTLTVTQNGQTAGTFGANQNSAGSIAIVAPDWNETTTTAPSYINNKPTLGTASSQDVAASITDGGTGLTTSDQVYDALHDTSNVGDGGLTVTINGTAATGTYTANQSSGSILAFTGIEETANKLDGTTGHTIADTTQSNEGTMYPSAKAVKDYVSSELTNTSNVGNGGLTVTINGNAATGTYTANQSSGSTLAFTGIEETANKASAIVADGSASDNSNDTDAYASTKAVYDYVQSQTGGNIIPEMPTTGANACDSTHPCALVTEDGEPVWKRIAQAGDQ